MLKKSIIYVNFSPYENVGKILDFLNENFLWVTLFSFSFHRLGKDDYNNLKIYHKGKLIETRLLWDFQIPERILFLFLPIRSIFIFIQIAIYTIYLRFQYGKFQNYFTVNAYTAWIGNILKKINLVSKTTFWVWDYYPPIGKNRLITIMRMIYWQFDKLSTRSDKVVFLNQRLIDLRKNIGILPKNSNWDIVPIGTDPRSRNTHKIINKQIKLAFIGVLKKSQGLDLFFEREKEIYAHFPNIEFHIIGSGPDERYFKEMAKKSILKFQFYGILSEKKKNDERKIQKILSNCNIGIATYIPEESNVSYYGDPAKIKKYLSAYLPVITTDVFYFSEEIKKSKAGIIIDYYEPKELIKAIYTIIHNYPLYQKNAIKIANKYNYKRIYPTMFR